VEGLTFKFHIAALEAKSDGITLYPVMDGVYVTSKDKITMEKFLRAMYKNLAKVFIKQEKEHFLFVLRGAVAFGEIYHGRDIGKDASNTLNLHQEHKSQILLGEPMINAHLGERNAPPFGIYIHETAKGDDSSVGSDGWWRWFQGDHELDAAIIGKKLSSYFDWCYSNREEIHYNLDRILVHKGLAELYFVSRLVA